MSPSKGLEVPEVRAAGEGDRDALADFECSSGLECEEEVERFINGRAIEMITSGVADYRMLLAEDEEGIAGLAAHHLDLLTLESGATQIATRLHVIAVATRYRGPALKGGERLTDRLIAAVIEEVERVRGNDIYTAIVANENDRSLEMFERCGSWSQIAYDAAHVRLTGRFAL